jgi:hypothetical protein
MAVMPPPMTPLASDLAIDRMRGIVHPIEVTTPSSWDPGCRAAAPAHWWPGAERRTPIAAVRSELWPTVSTSTARRAGSSLQAAEFGVRPREQLRLRDIVGQEVASRASSRESGSSETSVI